jgi:diadenosine tetraphosphate (Ap4A) HIT family hydrolase
MNKKITQKNSHQFVDLDNAREDDQKKVMQEIFDADHCPFCLENLRKYHKQEVLREGKFWMLTSNQWPYKFTKVHLLAIYKEHATKLSDLNPDSGKELLELLQWAEKKFKIVGGGFVMRFGDTNYSAGTVNHLHIQFIQPDISHSKFEPVRIKLGKG